MRAGVRERRRRAVGPAEQNDRLIEECSGNKLARRRILRPKGGVPSVAEECHQRVRPRSRGKPQRDLTWFQPPRSGEHALTASNVGAAVQDGDWALTALLEVLGLAPAPDKSP